MNQVRVKRYPLQARPNSASSGLPARRARVLHGSVRRTSITCSPAVRPMGHELLGLPGD